jgi:glycosidase
MKPMIALLLGLALVACAPAKKEEPVSTETFDAARAVIYEVNLRQYTPEGTIAAFRPHLPRLRGLGVDLLWLMPIQPVGELRRKGSLGSPYSVRDYRAIDPAFGSLEEFRELVAEGHALGFRVILDWVANHCAWDNPLVEEHPDWLSRDGQGQPHPPVPDWSDVVDLDYSQPELRAYMAESMAWWLRETDIDGFRCDVAGMVPLDFWREARPVLEAVKPVFLLAEWDEPELHEVFDASYAWDLHHGFNRVAQGLGGWNADSLDALLQVEARRYPPEALRMRFTDNHDENSWNGTVGERLGPAADVFTVLCYALPGLPLIYSGQEAGLDHRLSFFEKDSIPWREHPRAELFRRLGRLKASSPALAAGPASAPVYRRLQPVEADPSIWAFLREGGGERLLCVANLSGEERGLRLEDPALVGPWTDLEGHGPDSSPPLRDLRLPAWGWHLSRLRLP